MVNYFDKLKNLDQKKKIAQFSAKLVQDGMIIGLGSGSTMAFFVEAIATRIKNEDLKVQFVPASHFIEKKAKEHELKLVTLEDVKKLDAAFDGADWILNKELLIKGGGGSLFREKKLLLSSSKNFILADDSKFVQKLIDSVIPIEIVPFGYTKTIQEIEQLGSSCILRKDLSGETFLTDNQNFIVDILVNDVDNWNSLNEQLKNIHGVVDTGIFLNMSFNFITLKNNETILL